MTIDTLNLSEAEHQQLSTLASHYELTEGEVLRLAFLHYLGELDIMFIPG